jgi:Neuraminidase (sialidase)
MISNKQKHEHDEMHAEHVKWFDENQSFRKDLRALLKVVSLGDEEIVSHEREIHHHMESSAEADLAHLDYDHKHHQSEEVHARMKKLLAFARELELID